MPPGCMHRSARRISLIYLSSQDEVSLHFLITFLYNYLRYSGSLVVIAGTDRLLHIDQDE
jgi:hypothetical protein